MHNPSIFYPVVALAFWTLLVLLLTHTVRIRSAVNQVVKPSDFKYGESASVPPSVSLPNRNYMNLLEAPMLFYVACFLLFITGGVATGAVILAWSYVVLRMAHTVIHLSYNRVVHRLIPFAISNVILLALWCVVALHLASNAQA